MADSNLAKKAIAHFEPIEGTGIHAVWHGLIFCDLNIEEGRRAPHKDAAAATRIRKRAQGILKHVMKMTKGMSEAEIEVWFSKYIQDRERVSERRNG
jgi:hypothetical protein